MRVGICGYATAGKDEVAKAFIDSGFASVGMSDALNDYLCILNPIVGTDPVVLYADAVNGLGYVMAKEVYPEIRRLLQVMGTEVGRKIDPDMWVTQMLRLSAHLPHTVTTGIRFPNEAAAMDALVYVERPGVGPLNDHASEDIQDVIDIADFVIVNDGTIEDLHANAGHVIDLLALEVGG